jgi:hypothetical protein
MTVIQERRRHLSLLAAGDLERMAAAAELHRRVKSAATWAADIGFWLVYGGGMGLVAYIAFCARP